MFYRVRMVFFALLEYTQNKRHRKIDRPQQVILNDAVEQLMEAGGLTALTQAPFNEAMKIVAQRFINAARQGELEHHLTREYENLNEEESAAERVENKRNGYSKKTLHDNKGDLEIQVPRDRKGTYVPRLVPKHSRHFNDFDDAIIDLYGRGLSAREITEFIRSQCPKSIFFLEASSLPPFSDAEATPSAGHGETGLSFATLVAFHPEDEGGRSRTISAPKENITENLLIFKALAYDCPGPSPFSADTCKIRFLCTSSSVMSALLSRRSFLTQTAALAAAGIPFTVPAAASWSAEAFARTRSVTDAVLAHPFLQELASGTIAREKVLWYLAQNVIYLKGYGESLTRVEKRLTDAADRRLLTQWIKETAQTEVWMLELIEKLRDGRDITALTRVKPSTLFYVSWEAKATLDSSVGAAWAALLPCFTLYETVGKMIAANVAPGNPYQAWLGAYGDPAYSETVKKAVGLADRLATRETAENRARMTENYLTSCRLEWILWDAAWRLKGWPF